MTQSTLFDKPPKPKTKFPPMFSCIECGVEASFQIDRKPYCRKHFEIKKGLRDEDGKVLSYIGVGWDDYVSVQGELIPLAQPVKMVISTR